MAITFRGTSINGTHGEILAKPWDLDAVRTHFQSVIGESEIQGQRGGRMIVIPEMWLHGNYLSSSTAAAAIETINRMIGMNGSLVESGTISRTHRNCTLEGFEVERGPIYDGAIKWFVIGSLVFRQLGE